GLYKLPAYPATIGMEAAGVVESVGEGVALKPGDRVAYANPMGSYCTARTMPAERLVALPAWIDDRTAAGAMLQGMTAQYLLRQTYAVQPGDWVLVHAAAGGVGQILTQWATHLGAKVIATAGGPEKVALAKAAGALHAIDYRAESFAERVREITEGRGVDVVYDGVGRDTFMPSLDCLRRRGMMVTYGNASGPVPAIEPLLLGNKGGLFLTRPSLFHYTHTREELMACAADLFAALHVGAVTIAVNQTYPLAEVAQAHRDLEARRTTGKTVLLP
ncbi:MAG TPA: quinone oxidoreductase, partial [Alphaproteobacteria bacterium]|nr:quinone oxidoreductase [Alphaproteobacteria bacterium]